MADTFFSGCIGSIKIDAIIPYILEMGPENFSEIYSQVGAHLTIGRKDGMRKVSRGAAIIPLFLLLSC